MATYDLLAPHYDAVTGDSATEAAFVHGIIEQCHGQAATLLDVACGTGGITALLAGAYQVSGLDISPGMLAVAREKLPPGTPLYLADMTSFTLNATFDVIVCAYQGVNHLLSLSAWKSFFDCAYDHLNDGGVLVFDIATVGYLTRMASGPRIAEQFADNYLLIRVGTADGAVFQWQIEVYELQPDGRYRLLTETVEMRSFPVDRIREALRPKFISIETVDPDGDSADQDDQDRIWFACAKPPCRLGSGRPWRSGVTPVGGRSGGSTGRAAVRAERQWHVVDGEAPFPADVAGEREPPAEQRPDPVAPAGEEADVDEQPDHPAGEAAEVHPERRDDRFAAGDVGGRAQIAVLELLVEALPLG